jgi:hypothetical protein
LFYSQIKYESKRK